MTNECAVVGIQWGSFMLFVGASNNGTTWVEPTLANAFNSLEQQIKVGLNLMHPTQVTFHRPH